LVPGSVMDLLGRAEQSSPNAASRRRGDGELGGRPQIV
jgi:hypothetical protein